MPVHSRQVGEITPERHAKIVMQSNQITRCPDCRTAFQVTRAQLEAAQGSVRCGSCLHTFDARACLVGFGTDLTLPEPGTDTGYAPALDPGAPRLNDPSLDPEILSVYADLDRARPDDAEEETAPATTDLPKPRFQIPDSIAHGPLELKTGASRNPARRLAWGSLNLLLLLALVGQLGYLYFDAWRIHAWAGPWIEKSCRHVTCPAPRRNVLDLLTTRELRVRSHPERPEVLVVELHVLNRATFSQPLPVLEIEFIDVLGSSVESRRISPERYMPGFDASTDFLRAESSVQILLETPDPGDHAANYSLRLHAANGA